MHQGILLYIMLTEINQRGFSLHENEITEKREAD